MQDEIDIIKDVSGRLDQAGIGYMLTGSMAMNFYTQPRMTRDIDLVVALMRGHIDKILSLFQPSYYVSRDAISISIEHSSIFNLIHQETVIKVDCIIRKPEEYRQIEFSRRQRIQIRDFQTWIVSKEDLIISKLEWARDSRSELQFRDVRNLLGSGYDSTYLEMWVQKLGLSSLLKECQS